MKKMPFSIKPEGNKLVPAFAEKPVALRWDKALAALGGYVQKVDTNTNGDTVTLTLKRSVKADYYQNTGLSGPEGSVNGLELDRTLTAAGSAPVATMAEIPPAPAKKWKSATATMSAKKSQWAKTHPALKSAQRGTGQGTRHLAHPPPASLPRCSPRLLLHPLLCLSLHQQQAFPLL